MRSAARRARATCWSAPLRRAPIRTPAAGSRRAANRGGCAPTRGAAAAAPAPGLPPAGGGPTAALSQVKSAGVAVLTFPEHHDVDTVRDKIKGVAKALEQNDAVSALVARFDREWQAARAAVGASRIAQAGQAPRVLFVL